MNLSELIKNKGFIIKFVAKDIGITHATILNWSKKPSNITIAAHEYFSNKIGKDYLLWYKTTLKQ